MVPTKGSLQIDFSQPERITKEVILSKISDIDIFRHYLGSSFKLKKLIKSPLRINNTDEHPSFHIFPGKDGKTRFKDHGGFELSGDCFGFVQHLFGVNYNDALNIIYRDLIQAKKSLLLEPLINGYSPHNCRVRAIVGDDDIVDTHKTTIDVETRPYTFYDSDYWRQLGVSLGLLHALRIKSVKAYSINNFPKNYINYQKLVFAYEFGSPSNQRYQIYTPSADKSTGKFFNNLDNSDIFGYDLLPPQGNLLIITKSMKDVATYYGMGYAAIAPRSENTMIDMDALTALRMRFTHIIVNFDNDPTGREATRVYTGLEDFSDNPIKHMYTYLVTKDKEQRSVLQKDLADVYRFFHDKATTQHFVLAKVNQALGLDHPIEFYECSVDV